MKILLTADPELPVPPGLYGGIERVIDVLIKEYQKAGHEVTLCANRDSVVSCRLVGWKGSRSQSKADMVKNMLTLSGLVYREKFDVLHSFSRLAYLTAILPKKLPKIMSYQREPTLGQVQKAARFSRPGSMVFTGCSDYITGQLATVSEALTVYNCAPFEKYDCTERVDEDAPLMFLGRIEDIKGTHLAIAVAKRSGRRLIIAGNIPQGKEAYFEEKVKPYLNDRIVYIGAVNDEQKNEWLGKSAVFLMPIQWNEPFGIVMAEAMACGTPVLGLRFGSVPEVVDEGITGFVCNDVEEMLSRLDDCFRLSRRRVREQGQSRFSNEKIASDYLNLYSKLIQR